MGPDEKQNGWFTVYRLQNWGLMLHTETICVHYLAPIFFTIFVLQAQKQFLDRQGIGDVPGQLTQCQLSHFQLDATQIQQRYSIQTSTYRRLLKGVYTVDLVNPPFLGILTN